MLIWKDVKLQVVLFWCQKFKNTIKNIIRHIDLKSISSIIYEFCNIDSTML
ncbi:hypothetical protein BDD43_2185 [Mucilaginibacter gracilis]|uniref:Uncharacterized protein n=1 Tax=Mucilaginibacter gracilis TaxID=423350 RepID=A0A495IZ64_9SPHI|nr:hypothetical protein BDD43_2185 [Mucilaginibacter gracilis]